MAHAYIVPLTRMYVEDRLLAAIERHQQKFNAAMSEVVPTPAEFNLFSGRVQLAPDVASALLKTRTNIERLDILGRR